MKNYVLIMAAGSGSRMGREKQFIEILDKPVIYHTIRAFNQHEGIDDIIVLTSEQIRDDVESLIKRYDFDKVSAVVLGGDTRGESVKRGLDTLSEEGNVLIHDGARPLVSKDLLDRILFALEEDGAVIPAIPLKDTIKEVRDGFVEHTLHRPDFVAVQTPQAFRLDIIKRAFESFDPDLNYFDDAMVIEENLGQKIRIVAGDERNIKATTPMDIKIIDYLMREGGI